MNALDEVKERIAALERLPVHAMQQPMTHYDYYSLLKLIVAVFEEKIID